MPDYGHELTFGAFVTPSAQDPDSVVLLSRFVERVGLDLLTFQDHPYQPAFLDTWTLLAYVAARTERITLSANVLNLPLRQPLVLARSAASLDLLSGGRLELGLGSGAFWDAIEASGGPRRAPREAVQALEEAIEVLRQVWAADAPGGVRVEGDHYRVVGAKRGPAPAHAIGIWLGAYKPRMLRLTGAKGDGWLPSWGYLPGGLKDLDAGNRLIDDAALEAGRAPNDVVRLLNIASDHTAEQLAEMAVEHGTSVFILGSDEPTALQHFAAEVAPEVRELVESSRTSSPAPQETVTYVEERLLVQTRDTSGVAGKLAAIPTKDEGVRLSARAPWDESTRPTAPPPPDGFAYRAGSEAVGQHLVDVHNHLRKELETILELVEQVRAGTLEVGAARNAINTMTMRQNDWTLGAYCAAYCRVVTGHHSLEDAEVFPHLRRADTALAPVIDRLEQEHVVIHDVLEGLDRALVDFLRRAEDADFTGLDDALALLSDALLSHLAYEEQQIVEPLARLGFYAGQV